MFTGIIQEIGIIERITNINLKKHLIISCNTIQNDLIIGESIACNGICLTVISFTNRNITVEIMNQTMKVTTAKKWQISTTIHLEKALSINGRLNGHIVQGHVDTTMFLIKRYFENKTLYLEFGHIELNYQPLIIDRGSICIDGVSLTVAEKNKTTFKVALIQHTIALSHLGNLKIGEHVNIEFDIIGKYQQKKPNNCITKEWLAEKGWI